MAPLMARLADRFTVIAPDTPGFGLSERLANADFTIDELADGLVETLAALGIEQAAFAGQHTGATIIAALLGRYPRLATCAALDGYTAFDEHDRRAVLPHYTRPFAPRATLRTLSAIDRIDHVCFAVHDLARAAATFRALGFTLTERADHTAPDASGKPRRTGTAQHTATFAERFHRNRVADSFALSTIGVASLARARELAAASGLECHPLPGGFWVDGAPAFGGLLGFTGAEAP